MIIKNTLRKERIKEFIDQDHEIMDDYYDVLDSNLSEAKMEKEMRKFIKSDEYFFDPYYILFDIMDRRGRRAEAAKLLKDAFQRAVSKIADQAGDWPEEMAWGFLENRHLMRIIEKYGLFLWEEGDTEAALDIFRRLLRANPGDNQGMRHNILAIRLGLGPDEWQKPLVAKRGGQVIGLDAGKLSDWFEKNAKKFPEEFDWLFKIWEDEGL